MDRPEPTLEHYFHSLRLEHFEAALPPPRLEWNSRMSSAAGRFTPGRKHFLSSPAAPLIEVASYLRTLADGAHHIRDTILHEMIHYYLWWQGKPYGHNEEFYAIMKRTGATRYNPVPRLRPIKYFYDCPHCRHRISARRDLGAVACLSCCRQYTRGKFDYRFLLLKREASTLEAIDAGETETASETGEETGYLSFEELQDKLRDLKEIVTKAQIRIKQ